MHSRDSIRRSSLTEGIQRESNNMWACLWTAGYWAYGNEVSPNLTDSLSGPAWAKAVAYMAAFVQILVSLHVSLAPFRIPYSQSSILLMIWTHIPSRWAILDLVLVVLTIIHASATCRPPVREHAASQGQPLY